MSYIENSRIVYINSRNRVSGDDSNFLYKLDLPNNNNFDSVAVLQCVIPKTYYLVQRNSYFTLSENGNSVLIEVPEGNYTRSSFRNKIQSLLNSDSPNNYTYTVTVPNTSTNPDTGKYTFTVSNNSGVQPILIFTDTLYEQFGFSLNTSNQFVNDTLESVNVIKMQVEDALFIHSNICGNNGNDILQEIYTTNNPDFSEIVFENNNVESYSKKLTNNSGGTYHFSLTNEDGQIMYLNGGNIVLTLLCYKKSNIFDVLKLYLNYRLGQK